VIETIALAAFGIVVLLWVGHVELIRREHSRELAEMREAWACERQQLLDRIQAPSFAELKQAEVKIIKAQQGREPEPPPLEPL